MIRLVVSDMDGTLLDRDEILPAAAPALVESLRKAGIGFTVATGRVECMAREYVSALGLTLPYIACNGATVMAGTETLRRAPVPVKALRPILEAAREMKLSLIYTILGEEYVWEATPWVQAQRVKFDRYHQERPFSESDWDSLRIDKLTIMDDVRDGRIGEIEAMFAPLKAQYHLTRYTDKSVEIVDPACTKASAVAYLAQRLGFSMEEVMTIGDHQNDVEMLLAAKIGVAVGNATVAAKEAADYVCAGRCFDGVQEAVQRFCFGEGL